MSLIENIRADGTIDETVKEQVKNEMKNYFRPEFLNRIDDIVVFSPLTEAQVGQIISLSLKSLEKRLADRDISLVLSDEGRDFIAKEAYDPNYGARPVNRYIQKYIETELAAKIIRGDIVDGNTVTITANADGLDFEVK